MSTSNQLWWMQSKNNMTVLCNGNNDQLTEILLHEKITSKNTQQASDAAEHSHSRISMQSNPAEVEAVAEYTYPLNEGGMLRCHRCKGVIGRTSSMPTDQPPMRCTPNYNHVEGGHMTLHLNLMARSAGGMEETGINLLGNAEDSRKTGRHFEDWHSTI